MRNIILILLTTVLLQAEQNFPGYRQFSYRAGLGYGYTLLDMNFDRGTLGNEQANIVENDVDSGLTVVNFAFSAGIEKNLLEFLSAALHFDYHIVPVDNLFLIAESASTVLQAKDDIADIHTFSILAVFKFQFPISLEQNWLIFYLESGLGANFNISDKSNFLDVEQTTLGLVAAGGIEYTLDQQWALFLEMRWNYNQADFEFTPDSGYFEGDMDLSVVTLLIGIDFYSNYDKNVKFEKD